MRRKRAGAVRLSDHAYERWGLRVGGNAKRTSVAARIRRRIAVELKLGAEVNRNGALEVEIRRGIWAICYPSFMGGWVVATIIREGWEDMEERARYGEKRSKLLSKEEYKNTQEILLGQAGIIAMLDLEGFLRTLHHAEGVAPIIDPTLFLKASYGQGADNLQAIKEIAGAALAMKKAVDKFKGKCLEREAGSL